MKALSTVVAAAVLIVGTAQAHMHLETSTPLDGSVVTVAPSSIELTFSTAARLTALTIHQDGAAEQKLAPLPATPSAVFKVTAPQLPPGSYVVHWRTVGDDGHVMKGEIRFSIDPHSVPNTGKTPEQGKDAH